MVSVCFCLHPLTQSLEWGQPILSLCFSSLVSTAWVLPSPLSGRPLERVQDFRATVGHPSHFPMSRKANVQSRGWGWGWHSASWHGFKLQHLEHPSRGCKARKGQLCFAWSLFSPSTVSRDLYVLSGCLLRSQWGSRK